MTEYVFDSNGQVDWSQSVGCCSDVNCILLRKKDKVARVGTNGGCQHLKLDPVQTRNLLRILAQRYNELLDAKECPK